MATRLRASALAVALLAVFPLALMLAPEAPPSTGGTSAGEPPRTFVIVLENHEFDETIGNPEAPFLNGLAEGGALATRYYGITHPSLPNYMAILGGSTFGIEEDCTACDVRGTSLPGQLSRAGIPWLAYMEGLPHRCFAGAGEGSYVKRHNPFMYFKGIATESAYCRHVVPATRLDADLRRHTLPAFGWLTPDVCNDAHDCGIGDADRAMANLVPRLSSQLGPGGLLAITFDEGSSSLGCCGRPGGGRVATILLGPDVPAGTELGGVFTHYSLLAMLEDRYGLARLRNARGARPLPDFVPAG